MNEILKTLAEHPVLTVLLCVPLVFAIFALADCFNKLLRAVNIWRQGWPPPHCDGDGDPTGWEPEEEDLTTKDTKDTKGLG